MQTTTRKTAKDTTGDVWKDVLIRAVRIKWILENDGSPERLREDLEAIIEMADKRTTL